MDQTQTRGAAPRGREQYGLWRGVRVTDATLRVGDRTYQIGDLRRLREQPGRPQPIRRAVVGAAVAQAGVVAMALAGVAGTNGATPEIYAVAVAQGLVTTVLIGLAMVRWPTPTELWALHQGELTMLYSDPDPIEFGKVRRAVERAMLSHRLLK